MSTPNKNLGTIEIRLKWDPSPLGEAAHDLDLIAAAFSVEDPHGAPDHLVHFDARSPTAPSTSSGRAAPVRGSASTR